LASSNTVVNYGTVVQWFLNDSTGVTASTSHLAWYSTAAPAAKSGAESASTDTCWFVKTITFIPSTAQTSGGYVPLYEKDSSGPVLWACVTEMVAAVYSQTYTPPLECRPVWYTSKSNDFTTGAKFVFQLA